MIIHIYDFLNKNKLAQIKGSEFLGVNVNQTIDDFSSATLVINAESKFNDVPTQGFENVYIEDDNGNIIFGGILIGYNIGANSASINLYDHRWVLSRLILDAPMTMTASDDVLDTVEALLTAAKAKRAIPLEFDREGSAINPAFNADLKFEVGDDIGGALQKIIQTIYARWAVRYYKSGNEIFGKLVVRSVRGVTPEGVGIARAIHQSEDGELVTLSYREGDFNNTIQDFKFIQDFSLLSTRAKLGAKIGVDTQFYDSNRHQTDGYVYSLEFFFGRTEEYISDYKANSPATALAVANISQTLPRADVEVTPSPDFITHLNAGDRVNVVIDSPLLSGVNGNTVRIDSISYTTKDGYLERTLLLNFMSPQKRAGTTGLLQAMSNIQQKLDGLDKNYFNS